MRRGGFTLIELLVVILIIGILTAIAVPSYLASLENSRADDGATMARMVATTYRMYSLDNNGVYLSGPLSNSCNSASCAGASGACRLVACKYLAAQDWDNRPYVISVQSPANCGSVSGSFIVCASRNASAPSPYNTWVYGVAADGTMGWTSGAPTPPQ